MHCIFIYHEKSQLKKNVTPSWTYLNTACVIMSEKSPTYDLPKINIKDKVKVPIYEVCCPNYSNKKEFLAVLN